MPTPGQQSMFDSDAYRAAPAPARTLEPSGKLFDTSPYETQQATPAPKRPSTSEHVSRTTGGEQLKMFMTPKEVHAGWAPLDADRKENWDEGGTYEGTYEPKSWDTGDTYPSDVNNAGTHTYAVAERRYPGIQSGPGGNDAGTIRRTRGGGKYRLYDRGSGNTGQESDDDLWERKVEEASSWGRTGQHGEYGQRDPAKAHESGTLGSFKGQPTGLKANGGGQVSDTAWDRHFARENAHEEKRHEQRMAQEDAHTNETLYDSIAREGVKAPIHLGRQVGSMGKPQIVGGHHRLAVATDVDSDKLIPVMHHETIYDAQARPDYS